MPEKDDREPKSPGSRDLVLIVDDDPAIRFLVRENLEPRGFAVEEAADGAAGVSAFARLKPDIVLLDILMPGMDGFEVCARLRATPPGRNTAILVLSAMEDMESIDRAYGLGATDFATKPLNWSILPHRVRYLLRANRAMEGAQVNQARLEEAQRLAHIGSWEWDLSENGLIWSDEVYRIFGAEPQAFSPTFDEFVRFIHEQDRDAVKDAVTSALLEHKPFTLDHRIRRPDGEIRFVQERAQALYGSDDEPLRMIGTLQDVTERKQAEARVLQLAYYDELTGLPNRVFFQEQLNRVLAVAERHGNSVALILLDLDRFHRVNDTLGHVAGDQLLKQIALTLLDCLRRGDCVSHFLVSDPDPLARMGGDEFALMLADVGDPSSLSHVAARIGACLAQPFPLSRGEIVVTASLGIAIYPQDGLDADTLIKNADAALFHAKESGHGEFRYCSRAMQEIALENLILEAELREALERQEFVLHYQPQLDLRTGSVTGAEALIRWYSRERGLVMPGVFIPVAEQFGLISRVGEWVLREACRQSKAWQEAGLGPARLAVNLSGVQLRDPGFPDMVARELSTAGLDDAWIEMELTETTVMRLVDTTFVMLGALKRLGIPLAVDDFGTGYSSFSYLRRLPVDVLKIDRTFVENVGDDPDNTAIVSAIVSMAHSLNLRVVAEGVESAAQLDYLRSIQCDKAQGYYIGRPMPADRFEAILRNGLDLSW